VTVAVADPELTLLKVAVLGPLVCVQVPVPALGVLPPSDVETNDPQIFWLLPTVAVGGVA